MIVEQEQVRLIEQEGIDSVTYRDSYVLYYSKWDYGR